MPQTRSSFASSRSGLLRSRKPCDEFGSKWLTIFASRFAEYATLLDIDDTEDEMPLKDIVEHLVHWRKARVVDVVSLRNVYALRASFKTDLYVQPASPTIVARLIMAQIEDARVRFCINISDSATSSPTAVADFAHCTILLDLHDYSSIDGVSSSTLSLCAHLASRARSPR